MPAETRPKNCIQKSCIWRPGGHMHDLYMFISRLFSSGMKLSVDMFISRLFSPGMKLSVKTFSNLIQFGLHGSLWVTLMLLYFISIRAWAENAHIKNRIKNLMVIMPSYFYKNNKVKTSLAKRAILVTLQTYKRHSTFQWSFLCSFSLKFFMNNHFVGLALKGLKTLLVTDNIFWKFGKFSEGLLNSANEPSVG